MAGAGSRPEALYTWEAIREFKPELMLPWMLIRFFLINHNLGQGFVRHDCAWVVSKAEGIPAHERRDKPSADPEK